MSGTSTTHRPPDTPHTYFCRQAGPLAIERARKGFAIDEEIRTETNITKTELDVGYERDPAPSHIPVWGACRSSWETKGHLTSDCHTVPLESELCLPLYLQGPNVLSEAGGEGIRRKPGPLPKMALAVGH